MKDIGLKFEYSYCYSLSFKNDTTLNCKKLFLKDLFGLNIIVYY